MTTKDKQKTKTSLMDELKSIKGVLDTDDDNVPLLLDDELADDDIPVLADNTDEVPLLTSDDDIPVLTSPNNTSTNQASLDAAIRQLESMELSPKSKNRPEQSTSLEEKIRGNAAPPLFNDKATSVRENPFLKKPTDRFSESRKQAEEALKSVITHSRAISQASRSAPSAPIEEKPPTLAVKDHPAESPIEFSDNQFLKASSAQTTPAATEVASKKGQAHASEKSQDGSEEILKLLEEESEMNLDLGDDFGELVDIDVDALINEKTPPTKQAATVKPTAKSVAEKTNSAKGTPAPTNKQTDAALNHVIDEVIDEYMVILEAALRKKLKEKLPELLKK